jgi:hypothetical protein
MKLKRFRSAVSVSLTIIVAGFVGLLLTLSPLLILYLSIAWNPDSTLVVARHRVSDPTGVSLEALHISYDFIGGWEEATVYARRSGEVRKTLLFAYSPKPNVGLPEITFPDKKTIRIVVPWIQEAFIQQHRWNGYDVQYEIGKIGDPR